MRKILSLVLVLSLVLGSFGFAFAAPADVEGTDYEDAVTRLEALEILSGYEDGTFKPGNTITRAEFAKIMVSVLGVGEAAKYAAGETKFIDVPADHWAAGYINVASDMKVINGYGDGNFGPQDKVTYAQAVTMIVRALGYQPKADAMGGYPGGYLAVAAEHDITEDVSVVNSLAATRGDVAIMVDASLTVPMMVQKTWGQFPEYEEDADKTLMTTKLGVDEVSGRVDAIPNTDSLLDADEIKIDGDKYDMLVEGVNFDSLLGLEVTVWVDGDDVLDFDIDTDEDEIYFDTFSAADADDITLYVEDDTFDWATDAKAYVNFEEVDLDAVPDDAYGYAVLDSKEEVAFVNVFEFGEVEVGVVYEVEDDVYSYVEPDASTEELELDDFEDGVFIYNDKMELVDTDEIAVNSAIFAWETSDELYLVVKNETVEGTLERIKAAEAKIDDTSYDASALGAAYSDDAFDSFDVYDDVADIDGLGDESVTAVLDLNGELLFIYGDVETTSSTMYGVLTYAEQGSKGEATVFTKDDEEVDYVFEDRTDATGLNNDPGVEMDYFVNTAALKFAVIEYKLNSDGEIDEDNNTATPVVPATTTLALFKDADKNYVYTDPDGRADSTAGQNKYYISEDTIFMTALDSDGYLSPSVVNYEDIYDSAFTLAKDAAELAADKTVTEVVVIGEVGKDADFILFVDKAFEGNDDDVYYGVVTDNPWKDGSDYVVMIDVAGEGEKEYVVKDDADFTDGKVVKFHFNNDDEIVLDTPAATQDEDVTLDYASGYADIDSTDIKVADDYVLYNLSVDLKDDGTLDKVKGIDEEVKMADLDEYNSIFYLVDGDGMVVAATVYNTDAPAVVTTGWELALTDTTDDTTNTGINAVVTKPAAEDFANYSVAIYDGATLVKIVAAGTGTVEFTPTTDGLVKGKIYTVKVLKTADLSVIVEKNIANIN